MTISVPFPKNKVPTLAQFRRGVRFTRDGETTPRKIELSAAMWEELYHEIYDGEELQPSPQLLKKLAHSRAEAKKGHTVSLQTLLKQHGLKN